MFLQQVSINKLLAPELSLSLLTCSQKSIFLTDEYFEVGGADFFDLSLVSIDFQIYPPHLPIYEANSETIQRYAIEDE